MAVEQHPSKTRPNMDKHEKSCAQSQSFDDDDLWPRREHQIRVLALSRKYPVPGLLPAEALVPEQESDDMGLPVDSGMTTEKIKGPKRRIRDLRKSNNKKSKQPPGPMTRYRRPQPFAIAADMFKDLMAHRTALVKQIQFDRKCGKKSTWQAEFPKRLSELPKHAVLVRWRLHDNLRCYSVEAVYNILIRHGDIKSLGKISANSVIVVFEKPFVAKAVISRLYTESTCTAPLYVEWWYRTMYSESIDSRIMTDLDKKRPGKKSKEIMNQIKWRALREKIGILLRVADNEVCYKRDEFIP